MNQQRNRYSAVGGQRRHPVISRLEACDLRNLHAVRVLAAGQRHCERQHTILKLIAVDRLRRFALSVRTAHHFDRSVQQCILHLQTDAAGITQHISKRHVPQSPVAPLTPGLHREHIPDGSRAVRDRQRRASVRERELLHSTALWLDASRNETGLRSVFSVQPQPVLQLALPQLRSADLCRNLPVRFTGERLRFCAVFDPGQVQRYLLHLLPTQAECERQLPRLPAAGHLDQQGDRIDILSVRCGLQHPCAAGRFQCSARAVLRAVFRRKDRSIPGALSAQPELILQQIFRNILLMQSRTDLASGLAQHPIHLAIRAEPLKFRF